MRRHLREHRQRVVIEAVSLVGGVCRGEVFPQGEQRENQFGSPASEIDDLADLLVTANMVDRHRSSTGLGIARRGRCPGWMPASSAGSVTRWSAAHKRKQRFRRMSRRDVPALMARVWALTQRLRSSRHTRRLRDVRRTGPVPSMDSISRLEAQLRRLPDDTWCGACAVCVLVASIPTAGCGCPINRPCRGKDVTRFAIDVRTVGDNNEATAEGCLHSLGRRLEHALFFRVPLGALPRLANRQVLASAVGMTADEKAPALTCSQAVALITGHLHHLVEADGYRPQTVGKMLAQIVSLSLFMTDGLGKPLVSDICRSELHQWLSCSLGGRRRNGRAPSASTQRNRLTAARLFFRVLRQLGLHSSDPTLDLHGPRGGKRDTRPLTNAEILLTRYSCNDLEGNYLLGAAMAPTGRDAVRS